MHDYKVFSSNIKAHIYFERVMTQKDKDLINSQIEMLKKSIERRKNLLANENYVNKAPANIVLMDKEKLKEEEKRLKELLG